MLLGLIGGSYVLLVVIMLAVDLYTRSRLTFEFAAAARDSVRDQTGRSFRTIAAILSLWVATPLGYLLSRFKFPGRWLVDTLTTFQLFLPPLVLGLSPLILFHIEIGGWQLEPWLQENIRFTWPDWLYDLPGFKNWFNKEFACRYLSSAGSHPRSVVFSGCRVRHSTMRVNADQINPRAEDVARTLGCSRSQAFLQIALPQSSRGNDGGVHAGSITW